MLLSVLLSMCCALLSRSSASSSSTSSALSSSSSLSSSSLSSPLPPRGVYVCHAQAPTVITHAVTCSFTSPTAVNLILARVSRLDVMLVTSSGLSLVKELPIYGSIASLTAFLPPHSSQHRLIVTTDSHHLFVLFTDPTSSHFITSVSVDLSHRVGQEADRGQTVLVAPQGNCIIVHQYDGVLSCLPVDGKGGLGEVVDVQVEGSRVLDLVCLSSSTGTGSRPVVCGLYLDHKGKRHVKSFVLDVKEREARPGPLSLPSLDHSPARLIPRDDGGLLVVGEESAVLYSKDGRLLSHVLLTPCTLLSWARIDANRTLLADMHGDLSMLIVQVQQESAAAASSSPSIRLHRELLGQVTLASAMCYLGDSAVFLGSTLGDHQLVRLQTERGEDGSFIQLLDSFPNVGAIVDMAVMDVDQQGQGQVVTCSGAYQCGSLRVVRNGVGVEEEASIELPGIQGMWGVREADSDGDGGRATYHRYLVQSFVGETRVLCMEEDELGEVDVEGLEAALPTLHSANLRGRAMLQATEASVRVIDIQTMRLLTEWKEGRITQCASNEAGQVLVALGRTVALLRWTAEGQLKEERRVELEHEVACMDCTPLKGATSSADFAVVGLWTDLTLRVLALPSLAEVAREVVGGEVIPRSLLIAPFSPSSVFLLVGLGDGALLSFSFAPSSGSLSARKRLTLGSQPLSLSAFHSNGALHVFAACDRPTVVYCAQGRLLYSNVNLKDVHHMAEFNTRTAPTSLAFASSSHLVLGPIDAIQRLHIQTIPLQAQPRKVAWYRDAHCLLVLVNRSVREEGRRGGQGGLEWRLVSEVLALHDETFEVQSRVELQTDEVATALFVTREHLNGEPYVVVGAVVEAPDEQIPRKGRLLLLQVDAGQQLRLVSSTATKGGVTCIDQVMGKVVVGINSKVVVYRCVSSGASGGGGAGAAAGGELRLLAECSYVGKTLTWALSTFCQYVCVGDVLQSVAFLCYSPPTNTSPPSLEMVARDWDSASITAVAQLWAPPPLSSTAPSNTAVSSAAPAVQSAPVFLSCDASYNLFTFHRVMAGSEEDRSRVDIAAKFHLGDFVNCIREGSLVRTPQLQPHSAGGAGGEDSGMGDEGPGWRVQGSHLMGSRSGALLVVAPLGRAEFVWLSRLEEAMEKLIGGVGRLDHRTWRGWKGERGRREAATVGVVDGDLVEMALELRPEQQTALSQVMQQPWNDIQRRVEELSRIH